MSWATGDLVTTEQKEAYEAHFPNVSRIVTPSDWAPDSWRGLPIVQQPIYKDAEEVKDVLSTIQALPPLVHPHEVDTLGEQLAQAVAGEYFVIQGGDCVETFKECTGTAIEAKLKIILQMSLVVAWGAHKKTIRIGRMAGQYGKPRSSPFEKTKEGLEVYSFKGENINGYEPTVESRTHQPSRLLAGHFHSAATLNYIRAVIAGEIADLHHAGEWDLGEVKDSQKKSRYQNITKRITEALGFFDSIGVESPDSKKVDIFTSHEGLILEYESAVTKQVQNKYYNLGTHMLWIGNRTRQLNHAHVEYFRGISNPIGVKVGPDFPPDDLIELINILNPLRIPGKVTLITRYGAKNVTQWLPDHIRAIRNAGLSNVVLWLCDCVHGNTYTAESGYKTRNFDSVLAELKTTFEVHEANNSRLGGVHMEMTGENVTECVGGPQELISEDLSQRYVTYCDPRLNYLQSMELSFLLTDLLRAKKKKQSALRSSI